MTSAPPSGEMLAALPTLPTDLVRQVMWRFHDRPELQALVAACRTAARGTVARLVAGGTRRSHEWTPAKDEMLAAFDRAGITGLSAGPEHGGAISDPKNLAAALAALELGWVDGGAAACCAALRLAMEPLVTGGTEAQKRNYLGRSARNANAGADRPARGAFCLTEPLPYAGVETGTLAGSIAVAEWPEGQEPRLKVEKLGRFTTNMDFANFVVATVGSADPRIQGTCMVIIEDTDPGVFDRGSIAQTIAHQLASTRNPRFQVTVPASRIVGGYTVRDGMIIPNFSHLKILHAVLARTRITVGIASAAKLLSAVEPILRYQRNRFRGSQGVTPPAADLGLQAHEDVLHRLLDLWSTGEAAVSFGLAAARHFDAYDQLLQQQEEVFAAEGAGSGDERRLARQQATRMALEYLQLQSLSAEECDAARLESLRANRFVQLLVAEAVANVISPASKVWNTSRAATVLREAVGLMGGVGIMEECPGFLPYKWLDAQLESMYEGPESVHRRQLVVGMVSELFLAQFQQWLNDMRRIAARRPGTGACTLASAMELWSWTLRHLQESKDAEGKPLFRDKRQGVTFALADALCWLLASYCQIQDVLELEHRGAAAGIPAEDLPGFVRFFTDLCHVQTARAAGEVGRVCTELVFGYQRHPSWETDCERCFGGDEIDALESVIPGIGVGARITGDVVESDGSHANKAGPCVRFAGLYEFMRRRGKLEGCLTGARLAKDRAARELTRVAIPAELDYPQ